MSKEIIIAKVIGSPNFFIAGIDQKKQLITTTALFDNKEDAKLWVDYNKKRYNIKSSRIQVLHEDKILRSSINHGHMGVVIEVPGNLFNEFKPIEKLLNIIHLNEDKLWGDKIISEESDLVKRLLYIGKLESFTARNSHQ